MSDILQIEQQWEDNFFKDISDPKKVLDAGFQVYRQNHYSNLLSTLGFIYPICKQIIGEDFDKIALDYITEHESQSGNLHLYGQSFPLDLAKKENNSWAYIASLEWAIHFSYYAPDEKPIDFNDFLILLQSGQDCYLKFAKHTSFLHFPMTVSKFYSECKDDHNPLDHSIESIPESVLVTRHNTSVVYCVIPDIIMKFFQALSNGESFFSSIESSKMDDPLIIQESIHLLAFYGLICDVTIDT